VRRSQQEMAPVDNSCEQGPFLRSIARFRGRTRLALVVSSAPGVEPAPSGDAIEIAASSHVSTVTVAGCGCHVYGIDATTLSAECQ
jgi:hypothetical protein